MWRTAWAWGAMMLACSNVTPALGGSVPFVPAPHPSFPIVTRHTTGVFAAPELVTITYSDFAFRDQVAQFADFLVTSQWLDTVGAEYGVGHGVHLQSAPLPDPAPTTTSDSEIVALI